MRGIVPGWCKDHPSLLWKCDGVKIIKCDYLCDFKSVDPTILDRDTMMVLDCFMKKNSKSPDFEASHTSPALRANQRRDCCSIFPTITGAFSTNVGRRQLPK